MSDVESVREILRTLAEVRDGPFYSLWVELTYRIKHPLPQIGFRIFQVADSAEAILGVGVSATRPDGAEIGWSVGLETAPGSLVVSASVDLSDDKGNQEVFVRRADTQSCAEASKLIRKYASEVCAELGPIKDKRNNEDQIMK